MRTLYIECNMGVAGDMLMAALYELLEDQEKESFLHAMNHLGLPTSAWKQKRERPAALPEPI